MPSPGHSGGRRGASPARSKNMRLLVTGCAGFIGSNFVRYYLRQHPGDSIDKLLQTCIDGFCMLLNSLTNSAVRYMPF